MASLTASLPTCASVSLSAGSYCQRIACSGKFGGGFGRQSAPEAKKAKNGQSLEAGLSVNCSPSLHNSQAFKGRKGIRVIACAVEATVDKNELFKDAAKAGDLNRVRELLASGEVDVNLPSPERSGWTALQLGVFYEHPEVTSYLLWAGADTEARSDSGNTALQFACLKGNVQIAKMLLEAGADLDAASNDKGTAIDYAQEWGGEEIVDFLLMWAAHTRSA